MRQTLKQPLQDEPLVENSGCALIVSNSDETIEFTEQTFKSRDFLPWCQKTVSKLLICI